MAEGRATLPATERTQSLRLFTDICMYVYVYVVHMDSIGINLENQLIKELISAISALLAGMTHPASGNESNGANDLKSGSGAEHFIIQQSNRLFSLACICRSKTSKSGYSLAERARQLWSRRIDYQPPLSRKSDAASAFPSSFVISLPSCRVQFDARRTNDPRVQGRGKAGGDHGRVLWGRFR